MGFGVLEFLQELTCSGCGDPVFRYDNPGDKVVIRKYRLPQPMTQQVPEKLDGERIYCGTCVATSETKSMIRPTDYVLEIFQTGKEPKGVK